MMKRIKVINEPTELVPMLRALSTKVRREVFALVSQEWCTIKMIEEKFGEEGKEALRLFEKMKLVETRWQSKEGSTQPEKAFHSYYMSFHINATCPVVEISDVLSVAVMPDNEYEKWEKKIVNLVGNDGKFAGDLAEQLGITSVMLKSLVKRSGKLEFRGHRVERLKE